MGKTKRETKCSNRRPAEARWRPPASSQRLPTDIVLPALSAGRRGREAQARSQARPQATVLAGRRHCLLLPASTSHFGPLRVRATRPALRLSKAASRQLCRTQTDAARALASSNHQPSPAGAARPCICACVTEREAPPNVACSMVWCAEPGRPRPPLSAGTGCPPRSLSCRTPAQCLPTVLTESWIGPPYPGRLEAGLVVPVDGGWIQGNPLF